MTRNDLAEALRGHIQTDFPHLIRIWSKENFEAFIQIRAAKAFQALDKSCQNDTMSKRSNFIAFEVLFHGLNYSPYLLIQDTVRTQFPRFDRVLSEQPPGLRKAIITDLTVTAFPGGDLFCSMESLIGEDGESLPLIIARYLHQQINLITQPRP